MHLLLAVMKSWWLTTWKRKNISRVTREKIHITLNHFCIIFIFLYIIWVRFIYLNMFKIGIIWFAITKYVFSFPLSQIIFLLLTLITIIQFSIILTLISSSHTNSNVHITTVYYNILQHITTYYILQHITTYYNILHITTSIFQRPYYNC